jgi:hypothetical protein
VGTNWMEDRSVTAGPILPGDYNLNGIVDANDYVLWRKTLGQSGANLAADGNANNIVDSGDYNFWRAHLGQLAGTGAATAASAVPEPSAAILTLVLLITCACHRGIRS